MTAHGFNSNTIETNANRTIKSLYHTLNAKPTTSMTERIVWFSAQFLGANYLWGALGEGPSARYDQFPRYRVDAFDCETYVTTVLSLALANSLESFQQCLREVRYKKGKVSYISRNHFTSIDWNENNQLKGYLKDITSSIIDKNKQSVAHISSTLINQSGWYNHKTETTIRLQQENQAEKSGVYLN